MKSKYIAMNVDGKTWFDISMMLWFNHKIAIVKREVIWWFKMQIAKIDGNMVHNDGENVWMKMNG